MGLWLNQVMLNLVTQVVLTLIFALAGTGGSDLPNLKAEFSDIGSYKGGFIMLLDLLIPISANSQFFICFENAHTHLDRQCSVFGKVIKGVEFVDKIKKGEPNSGSVTGSR